MSKILRTFGLAMVVVAVLALALAGTVAAAGDGAKLGDCDQTQTKTQDQLQDGSCLTCPCEGEPCGNCIGDGEPAQDPITEMKQIKSMKRTGVDVG